MSRYVDIDLFKSKVIQYANEREASIAIKIMDKVPFARVAEIRHAKWIKSNARNAFGGGTRACSLCGYTFIEPDENACREWEYCCKCGAKMTNN